MAIGMATQPAALALILLYLCPAQGCATPYDAIKDGTCPGVPAISYVWPRVLTAAERNANVSIALNNVPTDCIDMDLPMTPCAAHHESIPPLFRCVFTHPATGTEILSDELWAQPVVRTTGDIYVGMEPVVSCQLAALDLTALAPVFRSASEAGQTTIELSVGVRFRDLDLPFVGVAGGNVVATPLPPPPSPPTPPPAPPSPPPPAPPLACATGWTLIANTCYQQTMSDAVCSTYGLADSNQCPHNNLFTYCAEGQSTGTVATLTQFYTWWDHQVANGVSMPPVIPSNTAYTATHSPVSCNAGTSICTLTNQRGVYDSNYAMNNGCCHGNRFYICVYPAS